MPLLTLVHRGVAFRVSVVGQSFRNVPGEFAAAKTWLQSRIDHWGFLEDRPAYEWALLSADVIVSTARHEFFGISVVEAMAAGALPVLPDRLSYPEILGKDLARFLYDGTPQGLAERLEELSKSLAANAVAWTADMRQVRARVEQFQWPRRAAEMDRALESLHGD